VPNRAILVTGGCGFIGSHLADRLLAHGHQVVVVDNLSTGLLVNLDPKAEFHRGDVRDDKFLRDVFSRYKIGCVIHQAAKINWSVRLEQPQEDVAISVLGTLNVVENCLEFGVNKLIYASSVAVYGRPNRLPVAESDPVRPIYSYGVAKRCAEEYVEFYGKTQGLRYATLRYANVYGPRQPVYGEVGVIANYTDRLTKGEDLVIYGNGEHVRDYVYIDDVIEATLRAIELDSNRCFNIGRGIAVTTNQVFDSFCRATGRRLALIHKPEREGELGKLFLDVAEAERVLGWRAKVSLEEGVGRTLRYYRLTG
jgi:UDP-glucose 4-epimerase